MTVPQKLKWESSAISFPGINPRKIKTYFQTKTCTQMFIAALFIVAKKHRNNQWINQWINKWNVAYPYDEILFSDKKGQGTDTCYNMGKSWRLCKMKEGMGTVSWLQDLWE